MGALDRVEAVGWKFFGATSLVFAPLGGYWGWTTSVEEGTLAASIATGVTLAIIAAAFFTFVVNELLHRRNLRRHAARQQEQSRPATKPGKHTT